MKKLTYLCLVLGLCVFISCGQTKEEVSETLVCYNTGEPCLADHSCCVVKQDVKIEDSIKVE